MDKDIRLLTKAEKEYILAFCQKRENMPSFGRHPVIWTIVAAMFGCFWGFFFGFLYHSLTTGLFAGTISFMIIMGFMLGIGLPIIFGFKTIPEMIEKDLMFVQEARYENTVGKPYMIFVTRKIKGKMKYASMDMVQCEKFEPGDRIILLQMRGRKWAFRARK